MNRPFHGFRRQLELGEGGGGGSRVKKNNKCTGNCSTFNPYNSDPPLCIDRISIKNVYRRYLHGSKFQNSTQML